MSYNFTNSNTQTFTLTHAKYLSSKVTADLKRIQRFYGVPSDTLIANYEVELTEFLKAGYLSEVTYGFKRDGCWIEPTVRYMARDLAGMSSIDDDPGKIRPNADISGASWGSYLIHNTKYELLANSERQSFERNLPFSRASADIPGINGYLNSDRSYSAADRALDRSSIKSY